MNHKLRTLISVLALASLALGGLLPVAAEVKTEVAATTPPSSLLFIENAGQFASGARFQVRGAAQATVWLAQDAIWLVVVEAQAGKATSPWLAPESGEPDVGGVPKHGAAIKLSFVGANPAVRMEPFNRMATHVSYFLGSDPAGWRADVPVWGGVRYVDLYPGIDLELAGDGAGIVPRLVARPGADLSAVRLRVEGAEGVMVENGMLRLSSAVGEVSWPLLQVDGATSEAHVQPRGAGVFEVVSPLQVASPLAVTAPADDPSDLLYNTYLGGNNYEQASGIAVDGSGAAYAIGSTYSGDFPTTPGAFDTSFNGGEEMTDAFVVKLNANGSAAEYATFLGGNGSDYGNDLALGGGGAVIITGSTTSTDFPVTPGAYAPTINGIGDAFVVKLNATGSALEYSTFLGGSAPEEGISIANDANGAAYILGMTISSDFPVTLGAYDTSYNGGDFGLDGFVAKLNAAGSDLEYATFLGGSEDDWPKDIAVDGSGCVYATGHTGSSDFPTPIGFFDPYFNGGEDDAFAVKLNATGSTLVYGTFLGGDYLDFGYGIAVDASGAAYVTGGTGSSDFPTTPGAFETGRSMSHDAFVVKLNPTGTALLYGTFLGGSIAQGGEAIALDGSGAAYITGFTHSTDFPTTEGAFDTSFNGSTEYQDVFAVKLNATGSDLLYGTFLGGSNDDKASRVAVNGDGEVYGIGTTWSIDFPITEGAFDANLLGGVEAYVFKLSMAPTLIPIYLPLVVKTP